MMKMLKNILKIIHLYSFYKVYYLLMIIQIVIQFILRILIQIIIMKNFKKTMINFIGNNLKKSKDRRILFNNQNKKWKY